MENIQEILNLDFDVNVIPRENYPLNYPIHWHKEIEIIYYPLYNATDINPVTEISGKEYELSPGDILLIWQGELHRTIKNPDKKLIGFQFDSALLQSLTDFIPYIPKLRRLHHLKSNTHADLVMSLSSYLDDICDLDKDQESFYRVEKIINLLKFMTTLSKEADNAYDASMQVPGSLSLDALYKIQRSCVYITKNCSEDLSLNDVASMAGFSPNYFSRMFKETTGYNFVEYLMIERVRKAQRYLGDNSIPITEVAYLSGFKSISTFNRVFHQIKNCSPRQFRKYMVTV